MRCLVHPGMNGDAQAIEETILRQQVPIFAHLAASWRTRGRTVPGEPDQDWQHLPGPPRFRHHPAPRPAQDNAPAQEQ